MNNGNTRVELLRELRWMLSHRADPDVLPLADRHYNRQKPGSPQFVPPGRCVVLKAGEPPYAVWVTSWPFAQYVRHDWAGAWVNSIFRKENGQLYASDMIRDAVAATRYVWPEVPSAGIVTFIDPTHVHPRLIRGRKTWGHSYFEAGFKHVGYTKGGLWTFQMMESDMPEPSEPIAGRQ